MAKKKARRIKVYPIWTTRDGRTLSIDKMDDSHLVNTINYLERRALDIKVKMSEELETDSLCDVDAAEFFPILPAMRKLAKTRGFTFEHAQVPIWTTDQSTSVG